MNDVELSSKTLRDDIAIQALRPIILAQTRQLDDHSITDKKILLSAAYWAYGYADAMLKAREEK